jgi:hypothetical protein
MAGDLVSHIPCHVNRLDWPLLTGGQSGHFVDKNIKLLSLLIFYLYLIIHLIQKYKNYPYISAARVYLTKSQI